MSSYDFVVVGAGIFGVTTALKLKEEGHTVAILNPDAIPHHLAASTDISKAVRVEYGSDLEYMDMAAECVEGWRDWNDLYGETLYHETGFILATSQPLGSDEDAYDFTSYQNLLKKGFKPERFDAKELEKRFPAFNTEQYIDGFFHAVGGFVLSGRVVEAVLKRASDKGVDVYEGQTVEKIVCENGRVVAVETREGQRYYCGHAVICAGNFTPYLVPELKPYMRVTGHPVFHLKPSKPELFTPPNFSVFGADISTTGWYGFPYHPIEKVVKIANHGVGREIHPEYDDRVVTKEQEQRLREFLQLTFHSLVNDPIVYTRLCCYTDTLDGHFWIDNHPDIKGLSIGSGGSGHGMKMAPVLGDMIASVALGGSHKWSGRYRWRQLTENTVIKEEARFINR